MDYNDEKSLLPHGKQWLFIYHTEDWGEIISLKTISYSTIPKCLNASLMASSFSFVQFGCLESSDFGRL